MDLPFVPPASAFENVIGALDEHDRLSAPRERERRASPEHPTAKNGNAPGHRTVTIVT